MIPYKAPKHVKDIAKNTWKAGIQQVMVNFMVVVGGWKTLKEPMMSDQIRCTACDGATHHIAVVDPKDKNSGKVWICGNPSCVTASPNNCNKRTEVPIAPRRAIVWPKFCEINGIGDMHHDVKFDLVEQADGKITYMLKFVNNPTGVLLMQGDPGTGKTYASMAMCELFTRTNDSCVFLTQKQMFNKWLQTFNAEKPTNFLEKVNTTELLVIDDFGTSEVSPAFMSFLMELTNTRMQWKKRGTVISTNLDNDKFNLFCGEALADRIFTGQRFEFKGQTRRSKVIL